MDGRDAAAVAPLSRAGAAVVALVACWGLAVQAVATFDIAGSVAASVWVLFGYFTIITNVLVALLFTAIGAGWRAPPRLVAGLALCIALVGVVYALLLHGLELAGSSPLANVLLHMATPALVPLFWLAYVRKGTLAWRDPLFWGIYPLAYFVYALARGAVSGRYAYPFMNVGALGGMRVGMNVVAIGAGFLLAGWAMVALDRWLGRRSPSG
jgi:hypothetical protein